ncbi:phospholipase D-like domain-containing protein, partial [Actinoplanes sp. RD1]|uniref:phospholipase D-like domain-containing protein n=1 Tax=Actinoplanes sp. RD1 TaxID=3064538 RepID=UPI0027425D02
MAEDFAAGAYEAVLTEGLARRLSGVDEKLLELQRLRPADVADRIAEVVAQQLRLSLEAVPEDQRVATSVDTARVLIDALHAHLRQAKTVADPPDSTGRVLNSIGQHQPDGTVRMASRPLIPLRDTTVLTNAPGEPRVGSQIKTEIDSADAIDVVMAFVRVSGILPLLEPLRQHCAQGRKLRLLTTTYTGSTEGKALQMLVDLGANVRVSYDTTGTRLHAKSWLFHRESALSTAYVGSSNLTYSAQTAGKEWNVRVSAARNPDAVKKISAVFDTYWASSDFVDFDGAEFEQQLSRSRGTNTPSTVLS